MDLLLENGDVGGAALLTGGLEVTEHPLEVVHPVLGLVLEELVGRRPTPGLRTLPHGPTPPHKSLTEPALIPLRNAADQSQKSDLEKGQDKDNGVGGNRGRREKIEEGKREEKRSRSRGSIGTPERGASRGLGVGDRARRWTLL